MARSKKTITVTVPIDTFIQVTENHGGYMGATCILCNNSGWLEGMYGNTSDMPASNKLQHKKTCPIDIALLSEKSTYDI